MTQIQTTTQQTKKRKPKTAKPRLAVIGGGHLGKIHTRLLQANEAVDFVAVVEPSPLAQQAIIDQFDVEVVCDYQKIVDDIDAAVVATPTRFHFDIANDLLGRGIHTMVEKPLTDSVADAQALVCRAEESGAVVSVGHVERFNPAIRAALKLVGVPKFVQASRTSGFTFRSTDIGVVHDLMIHDIDLVNSMFDGDVEMVHATGTSVLSDFEDLSQATIRFAGGGVANLTASRCSPVAERSFEIFGSDGYAKVDLANSKVSFVKVPSWIKERRYNLMDITPDQQAFIRENLFSKILPMSEIDVPRANAIEDEHNDWLAAIRDGSQPTVTLQQGAEAVEIADKVIASIGQNAWNQKPAAGPIGLFNADSVSLPEVKSEVVESLADILDKAA
jgi:predicted dehydrogenase